MTLLRALTTATRVARDVHAVTTGHITRRVKNRIVGRALGRIGFWRRLWR